MKAVIFAGGVGTRLWPLSRKKSPKQFEKVVGDKSTLQLATERLLPEFKPEDIYISTGKNYIEVVKQQLPFIPVENIIAEPAKKDVGPAVALIMGYLAKNFPHEPVVILWSDHIVKHIDKFKKIIVHASNVVAHHQNKIIFIGHTPRFASENLGWIETNGVAFEEEETEFRHFAGFKYRPDEQLAKQYFHDKEKRFCWNLGYFVSTPQFVMQLFERFSPKIHQLTQKIVQHEDFDAFNAALNKYYADMPEINFDNAVLEQLDTNSAYVVTDDIGWSDVGAWEALKEALEHKREDNITKGRVMLEDSSDSLVYNYDGEKLIVGVDLEDLLVVNTKDVLLVAKKSSVSKIKKLVESFQGTENEHLT